MTVFRFSDPILEFMRSAFFEDTQEALTELIGDRQILIGLTDLIELLLLIRSELLFREYKEKGGLFGEKASDAWEKLQE